MRAYLFSFFCLSWILCGALPSYAETFHVSPKIVLSEDTDRNTRAFVDFLAVYKSYAEFLLHIKTLSEIDAISFFHDVDDAYLLNKARNDWLKELYRRGRFREIQLLAHHLALPDKVSQCYIWQSAAELHTETVWPTLFDHYLDATLPAECDLLMHTLTRSHFLSDHDRWARAHMLWDSGRYAAFIEHMHLFNDSHFPIRRIQKMIVDPVALTLSLMHQKSFSYADRESIIMSLSSIMYKQFDEVWFLWKKLSARLTLDVQQKNYWYSHFAYAAARLHNPIALDLYQKVDFHHLDTVYLEWYLRAVIREQRWALLSFLIENLPIALRKKTVWIYWLAYSKERLGQLPIADRLYASIAHQLTYYGVLASEAIGRPITLPTAMLIREKDIQHVLRSKAILRGIALFKTGRWGDAVNEWHWAWKGMTAVDTVATSHVAYAYGMYDRAIQALESTGNDACLVMAFPTPYQDDVKVAESLTGLPSSWLFAVMRQESRFLYQAHSSAGALGLMQLMPHTARHTAQLMGGRTRLDGRRLSEPYLNVSLGAYYLKKVYESLNNNIVLAIAAYNAGPVRVASWCPEDRGIDATIFIETIPFLETRNYVKKVLFNIFIYHRLLDHKAIPLHHFLGEIKPDFMKTNQSLIESLE